MKDKKSIENTLFDAMGEINDNWIEQATEYKVSSKIISFPFKYSNAVAALLLCIICISVFSILKPVNELNPEKMPTATPIVQVTEEPSNTEFPEESYLPQVTDESNNNEEIVKNDSDKTSASENTYNDNAINKPDTTAVPIVTDLPYRSESPTKEPNISDSIETTESPTDDPDADPTELPVITKEPESTAMATNKPSVPTLEPPLETLEPVVATETPRPILSPLPSRYPSETIRPIPTRQPTPEPTPRPTVPPIVVDPQEPPVDGIPFEIKDLNNADYYSEYDIINFTYESAKTKYGVELVNPISGNSNMVDDYGYLYDEEVDGLVNVFHLYGSELGWGRDTEEKLPGPSEQVPISSICDNRVWYIPEILNVSYPVPRNRKVGFSISFWAKTPKIEDTSAILVFADETQTLSVSINGSVNYQDGLNHTNRFSGMQYNYMDNQWHYYVVTFANDWITVYIDGSEVPYTRVALDKDRIGDFNNGFMTRYNSAITWTINDYESDWRNYISNQRGESTVYETITSDEYTVFGNGRYRGLSATERLLLTFMSGEDTKIYIGGAVESNIPSLSKYSLDIDTRVSQVKYYLYELPVAKVSASYMYALHNMPDDSNIASSASEISN